MQQLPEHILPRVQKPARYINSEFNSIRKDRKSARASIVLAFPDLYEIGMSYFGFKLLYERINEQRDFVAERTYAPAPDMEEQMRHHKIKLFSLESLTPVSQFDIIGFTLQSELNYTNLLNMLDLAGLPGEAEKRKELFPLVIAGGEGAFSPEPMADFIDCFVLGDGEEVVFELLKMVAQAKEANIINKQIVLKRLANIEGIYVPRFYKFEYNKDGTISEFVPVEPGVPVRIKKRVYDFSRDKGVQRPLVPLIQVVQDKFVVEIRRGCTCGCRFCRAGMINRPLRERPAGQIVKSCENGIAHTGCDEISLLSLDSAGYTVLSGLISQLGQHFSGRQVSLSLPSIRINSFDVEMAERLQRPRKSGLTFAPEAGTERLRRVINKPVDNEAFFGIMEKVFKLGWRTIKLYFMMGLPTETDDDLDAIISTIKAIERIGRKIIGRRLTINVSLSPFVPKSHTPFQWEGQLSLPILKDRYQYLKKSLSSRLVKIKWQPPEQSLLEATLSRGDRRLAKVLKTAWEKGAKFDAWSDQFRFDLWLEAFNEAGLDPEWYANRERGKGEILPWDHIDPLVSKEFLWRERERAYQEQLTDDCFLASCTNCGVCDDELKNVRAESFPQSQVTRSPQVTATSADKPMQRLRITFSKKFPANLLSHLDLINVLNHILILASLPLAYTRGYNPKPKLQFAPPLPVGAESEGEVMDVFLSQPKSVPDVINGLNQTTVSGITFISGHEEHLDARSLEAQACSANYLIQLPGDGLFSELRPKILAFEEKVSFPVTISRNRKTITRELKKTIQEIRLSKEQDRMNIDLLISLTPGEYLNPLDAIGHLVAKDLRSDYQVKLKRIRINFK